MKKTIQRALVWMACLATTGAFAQGIAFLTNLRGEVAVDGARPQLLSELARGQKLSLGKDAQAAVMYIASGKEYTLRGPGDYLVKDTEISAASGMPPVTRNTEWRASAKVLGAGGADLRRQRAHALHRAAQGEPAAAVPHAGQHRHAAADVPLGGRQGPTEVTLSVVGDDKPVHTGKASGTSYRMPAKLKPDTEYVWVVSAGASELGAGKFRTLAARRDPAGGKAQALRSRGVLRPRHVRAPAAGPGRRRRRPRRCGRSSPPERADLPELAGLAR